MEESNKGSNSVIKAGLILALAVAAIFGYLYFNEKQDNSQKNVSLTENSRHSQSQN